MMQCEFEEMIGKSVEYETFRVYEAMYNALPESYTKRDFVKMLDIKAIPEKPHSQEYLDMIAEQKAMLKNKQDELAFWQSQVEDAESWARCWEASESEEGIKQYKSYLRHVKEYKGRVRELKRTIRSLKSLLA